MRVSHNSAQGLLMTRLRGPYEASGTEPTLVSFKVNALPAINSSGSKGSLQLVGGDWSCTKLFPVTAAHSQNKINMGPWS